MDQQALRRTGPDRGVSARATAPAVTRGRPTGMRAPRPDRHQVGEATMGVIDSGQDPDCNDASEMYVIDVLGVSVPLHLRLNGGPEPDLYIHIDNEYRLSTDLAVGLRGSGET